MSNKTYQYVNLRYFNQETTTAHRAILEEQRAGNILDGKMYKLSVDRWNIEQAEFPVFEPIPALTYTVNIRD